jgi:hypothetical protein
MKQRLAQAMVLYAMDLEAHFGEFPIASSKQRFLTDPVWQPARQYVERLLTLSDWAETIVAVNLCFEPLVGLLVRRELGIRAAVANGDSVTPVLSSTSQLEWDWTRDWTSEFIRHVLTDEAHARANREVLAGWMHTWLPLARQAAQALAPLAERMPSKSISMQESIGRVERDAAEYFQQAGISELAEGTRT